MGSIQLCRQGDTAGIAGGSRHPASREQTALGFAQGRELLSQSTGHEESSGESQRLHGGCGWRWACIDL